MESFDGAEAHPSPFSQFSHWYKVALTLNIVPDREAMTLATASCDGRPSARMVLLKWFDESGFVFFSNYESRKARELLENPRAALILYWSDLRRQIRIEGDVERISAEESDAYFASRARGSQMAALASRQSEVIESRAALQRSVDELTAEYEDRVIPRPEYWGGFRLKPASFEFWQGLPDRLHDRLRYRIESGSWQIERLSP
jgi:pyridoxamine 5'-phosphate oxidase